MKINDKILKEGEIYDETNNKISGKRNKVCLGDGIADRGEYGVLRAYVST